MSTNGGLASSMLCIGGLGMHVYLNFWVKEKVPFTAVRVQGSDSMIVAGVGDLLALL